MGRRKGIPNLASWSREDWTAYFWDRMDKTAGPDGCWPWLDSSFLTGYGAVRVPAWLADKPLQTVHRVALLLTTGEPPPDRPMAIHNCDRRICGNPHHLRWATVKENYEDSVQRDRDGHGTRQPGSKLTDEDIPEIRRLRAAGWYYQKIADRFGVSEPLIRAVIAGRRWKHVP